MNLSASICLLICGLFIGQMHAQTPKDLKSSALKPTIISSTEASDNHKTLLAVVKAADMYQLLDGKGPFTVFAPSDGAFDRFPALRIKSLLHSDNQTQLKSILTMHIIAGNLSAAKILKALCQGAGKAVFTTLLGENLTATMVGLDIVLTDSKGNKAKIITADAAQRNGVIHVIDRVLMPAGF